MDAPRTHALRHDSPLGHWELVLREPVLRLRPYVRGWYEGFVESGASFSRRLEVPFPGVVLIVNLGSPWGLVDRLDAGAPVTRRDSFVAGLHDRYSIVESGGASWCVQVNLTPLGARRLFGVPMHELANRTTELEDLLGAAAPRVAAQLREAPSWEARFSRLESLLAARIAAGPTASAGVAWAWEKLAEQDGLVAIGALAGELGWSRKRLIAEFRAELGLPPKTLARVLRFQRVFQGLDGAGATRWAEIAHACGYYDQAHFNRDFREFAGTTPSEFLRRRLPDGGGVSGD